MLSILAIILALLPSGTFVNARSTPNEFVIQADNYDELGDHAVNCTYRLDRSLAVTYCGDGFLTIDDVGDLINPDTAFKVDANHTFYL